MTPIGRRVLEFCRSPGGRRQSPLWLRIYKFPISTFFLAAKILCDRVQVVVEALGIGVSNRSNFFNNWVFPHNYSSISSTGVQMTGGS